ncbi:hypothetical protein ABH287_13150, partial [Acinetobacter pittii]|uniref:hypothetical protein n=1 Tax=Acinetobacter pittii TaxID=48296 RepID=UPI003260A5FB
SNRIKPHQTASNRIKPHQTASNRIKPYNLRDMQKIALWILYAHLKYLLFFKSIFCAIIQPVIYFYILTKLT